MHGATLYNSNATLYSVMHGLNFSEPYVPSLFFFFFLIFLSQFYCELLHRTVCLLFFKAVFSYKKQRE